MPIRRAGLHFMLFILAGAVPTSAADACSLLTAAEVEAVIKAKVTATVPSTAGEETGCTFHSDKGEVVLSYFTDPSKDPNVKSIKDDPFMPDVHGPKVKDYGNIGCKWADVKIFFATNCNHYQPRWLHISAQVHDAKGPVPMDVVKSLLEKAASRFK